MAVVEGIIEEIIYRNESNGYTVLSVSTDSEEVTLVGTMFNLSIGEEIKAIGNYVSHHVYGMQLKVEDFQCSIPKEVAAMERYLGSGAIKGIGPALAKRVVEQFNENSFNIIEEEPERLAEVKGISMNKARDIASIFHEQKNMRQVIIFLQDYGISLTYAIKIYNEYKDQTIQVVQQNPYQLAEDIHGIGFKMADQMASRIGIDRMSPERLKAGVKYTLLQATLDGHLYLEKEMLLGRGQALLGAQVEEIILENILIELQIKQDIIVKEINQQEIIYLFSYYQMEKYIAEKLMDLALVQIKEDQSLGQEIQLIEKEQNLDFDDCQKEAIIQAVQSGVLVVTGGPGTGKTTTINAIIEVLENRDMEVLLAAPTGRAAKRMTETTGKEAKTIHRLLEIAYSKDELHQKFERNEDYPLECDVVIIDETSMLDISLMYHLLKAIPVGTRLILVGDQDQLPSVGPGNVLKDIIHSTMIETVRLTKIFRQAMESDIVMNAHKINQGQPIQFNNKKDFFFIRRRQAEQILREIITLVKTRLPKFAKCNSLDGIQILTPMRKGILGVDNLNLELQKALNPAGKDKREKEYRKMVFREDDKVMQIRNNYNISWEIKSQYGYVVEDGMGVFNGDVGRIVEINHYSEKVKVLFDDNKFVEYDFTNLDELELAYAITIHKAQGSEYPIVVMPILSGPPMLLTRNLLYTAVTRAKEYVVLVGLEDTIIKMVENNREVHRNSLLDKMIKEMGKGIRYGVESSS